MAMLTGYDFEVILGTREDVVMGYVFMYDSKALIQSFSVQTHRGNVRSITADTDYVVSGGDDKEIKLFDTNTKEIVGTLNQHTGAVTSLNFTADGDHLVSTSLDGSIAMYKKGSWVLDKLWQGAHKGNGVSCISLHPKGKLALSVAQDRSLKMWNLSKGRSTNTTNLSNLSKYIDYVIWSKNGTYYAIPTDHQVHVFDVSLAGTTCVITCVSNITTAIFSEDKTLIFGEQEGWLIGYDVESDKVLWKCHAATSSVKCIVTASPNWLISATNDGEVTLWRFSSSKAKLVKVTSVKCGHHVTCMGIRYPPKTRL